MVPSFLFLSAFGFAIAGLNPTFYSDDSPETVTACVLMGIPHPPGYPLYTLIGHLFSSLPLASIPFRVNLLSAVLGASVSAVLFFLLKRQLGVSSTLAGLFSLLWMAGATVYPAALSAKTGIYQLTALFLLGILGALFSGRLKFAAFLIGLSCANHWMSTAAYLPGFALLVFFERVFFFKTREPSLGLSPLRQFLIELKGQAVLLLSLFFLGLSVYLFLPLRAFQNPALNWGNPSSWHNFVFDFLRKEYSAPEATGGPEVWFSQWGIYLKTAFFEFPGLLLVALWGLGMAFIRDKNRALDAGFTWLSLVVVMGVYLNLPKGQLFLIQDYTLSSHIFILLFSAWGVEAALSGLEVGRRRIVEKVVLGALVFLTASLGGYRFFRERQTDYTYVYDYVLNSFQDLPRNALFYCRGDSTVFLGWYFQWVEKKRPDVAMVGVDGLPMDWVRKNLYDFHPGMKIPYSLKPLGIDSIPFLMQWTAGQNRNRELYFSYNKIDDGNMPGTKTVPYGVVMRGFLPGNDPVWDEARAVDCWDKMRLRHLEDRGYSVDSRTDVVMGREYLVFRNTMGIVYEDRGDAAKAKLTSGSTGTALSRIQMDYQKSLDQFAWAAERDRENPEYAYNVGNALYHSDRLSESLAWYEKATGLDPRYTQAYFNWAVAEYQLGQYKKAGPLFEKVLELKPDYPEAKNALDYMVQQGWTSE